MSWKDLLQTEGETVIAPWVEGKVLRSVDRTWMIEGRRPPEPGWHRFTITARKARWEKAVDPQPELLVDVQRGYLVGDRLVRNDARVDPDPALITEQSEPIHLVEPGLDRFVPIIAGRGFEDGPLIYQGQDMPSGPEESVLQAFLERHISVNGIPGVTPALDAAFRMESWQRLEADRRRAEIERRLREEEEKRQREERRQQLVQQLGDGAGRRQMALVDFAAAATAALAVGGATYLDHRRSAVRGEMVVRFRVQNRSFECTCEEKTLAIVDAGICLINHNTGEKGDTYFTLESLPAVIAEAVRKHKLVVFRHVGGGDQHHDDHDDRDDEDEFD
jgi:hypothetical protein